MMLPELETKCDECDGKGRKFSGHRNRTCGKCDGAGYIPTEFGYAIIVLMRHHNRAVEMQREDEANQ